MTPLVAIAGGSCTGKTRFASKLAAALAPRRAVALSLDDYYRDTSHLTRAERGRVNYDEPSAFALDRFVADVTALRRGEIVRRRRYDFSTGAASSDGTLGPADLVLAEGLFALWEPRLGEAADLRILLHGDPERLLARRIARDGAERAYSPDEVRQRFRSTVIPSERRYLRGAAASAHLVFPMDWNGSHVERAASRVVRPSGDNSAGKRPKPPRKDPLP